MKGNQLDLNVHQVLSQLANTSAYQQTSNSTTRPPQIYGKDLVTAVDILHKIAEYNGNYGNVSSTEHLKSFAQVASNLLESTNSKTWKELEKVRAVLSAGIVTGNCNFSTQLSWLRCHGIATSEMLFIYLFLFLPENTQCTWAGLIYVRLMSKMKKRFTLI